MSKKKNTPAKRNKPGNTGTYIIVVFIAVAAAYLVISYFRNEPTKEEKVTTNLTGPDMIKFKKEGELTFNSKEGDFLTKIDIEIAEDDDERADGLMYRTKMLEMRGMLFIFEYEKKQSFWMRNTFIPLDIIFVNKNYEIVKIHKNTQPFADTSYPSEAPAIYVVEVNGGFTDKYSVKEGDKIVWRKM